ncbi:MAG: hypothetical protein PW788_12965 [Micavibrio sp.]|nr:hypothetical protein [Micavibrio sp.]
MPQPLPPALPADYPRIKVVRSFEELVAYRFGPTVNALCWPRQLAGDFDEIAACFAGEDDVTSLDEESVAGLRPRLGAAGLLAADTLAADLQLMRGQNLQPSLECVPRYQRDDAAQIVPTDVYSYHADRAPIVADTYLCSYNQAASELVRNEEATRHVDIPATRAALLQEFEREGMGGSFEEYLAENCYDLHYAAAAGATPISFGFGNLWRIAIEYPNCPVPPCIHRAPATVEGRLPRLLLIS